MIKCHSFRIVCPKNFLMQIIKKKYLTKFHRNSEMRNVLFLNGDIKILYTFYFVYDHQQVRVFIENTWIETFSRLSNTVDTV